MPEHYTRNTLTATCWCNKCGRNTEHRIDDGRRGPCLEHETAVKPKPELKREEPGLFDDVEK